MSQNRDMGHPAVAEKKLKEAGALPVRATAEPGAAVVPEVTKP
jgi:hypothetical protein